jgi:hypothetical protein
MPTTTTNIVLDLSRLAAKAVEFASENPDASEADLAAYIVSDVDALSVTVFELAA